ncbi:hypothetical protein C8255_08450 [filamentous cyanobacterium CCP3]|nr:hypothetical protein C8255_08450 [filamentous cyanobacterium CCP3]
MLAVIGLVITIYFEAKKKKVLGLQAGGRILINNFPYGKIDDLRVTYGDEPIGNLAENRFIIWNAGKETIEGSDVSPGDPLKIIVDGYIIGKPEVWFKGKLKGVNKNSVRFREDSNKSELFLEFDYLDANDSFGVKFFHTNEEILMIPRLMGTLKRNGVIQHRVFGATYSWFYIRLDEILEAFMQVVKAIICLFFAIILIRLPLLLGVPQNSIFFLLWILFSFFILIVNMNKLYKKLERNPRFLVKYLKIKNQLAWWSTISLAKIKGDPFIEELQENSPFSEESK